MRRIEVPAVYIDTTRVNTREMQDRMTRILGQISYKKMVYASSLRLSEIIAENNWYSKEQRTGQKRVGNPNIIFSGFDWGDEANNPLKPRVYEPYEAGRFCFADYRDKAQLLSEKGIVCNPGFEIHTAFGCLHSCSYCHIGNALTIMLDIEKFIPKLSILMQNNPQQRLYKYDNQSDIPALEPEYGAINSLVSFFASTDNYLMLYTKSANLGYLPSEDAHKGHTICCWTISAADVARDYEIGAASMDERLEAAKLCEEKGYRTRFRFSPIIPVKGWKEKNSEMIEKVFEKANPEVISIETLCHMSREHYDALFGKLAFEPNSEISEYELFSHDARREIYDFFISEIRKHAKAHKKKPRIALCLETEKMWKDFRRRLMAKPENFYCCCGEKCA